MSGVRRPQHRFRYTTLRSRATLVLVMRLPTVPGPGPEARDLRELAYTFFDRSPLPMWIYDPRTLGFLAVNDAAVGCYGYSAAEFLSMTLPQIHEPAEVPSLDTDLKPPAPGAFGETHRHVRRDGTIFFCETVRFPVTMNGQTTMLAIAHDVSDSKRSELLYRMLMDAIPSSVLLLDEHLRVVMVNRNFLEKSRQKSSEIGGKRLKDVFPEVILAQMGMEQQIRDTLRTNVAMHGQKLTYRAPSVPIRVYYYSIIPVNWSGEVDHALLLVDDITEQTRMGEEIRRMERHLASVVESASDIVVSTDVQGNILSWNKAAEDVTGYSLRELSGRPFFDYCDTAESGAVRKLLSDGASRGIPGRTEFNLKTKDGSSRPASWVFSQMTDDNARIVGFVILGRDLTEHRKFELQILESQKLAALGVMARGIAHEIRTPLTISSSAAQFLLEDDVTPEFRRECAEKVYSGIRRASVIIENLLRFAQPSAEKNKAPVDLLRVVRNAVRLVEHHAKVQNVELHVQLSSEPCPILGVPSLLEQVFVNLLLNAMNAMPNGGTIDILSECTDSEFVVRVVDTGAGISPLDIDKIFDPFYTNAPPGKGTGLGLSICYSIIDQHRGSISAESAIGKGSTFTVKLPLLVSRRGRKP